MFGHWTQDCDDEEVGIFMIFNSFIMMSLKLIRHSRDFKSNFPVKLKNAGGVKYTFTMSKTTQLPLLLET